MKINSIIVSLILIIASCFCLSFGASAETEQIVFSYEKQYDSYSSEISSTVDVNGLKAFLRQELVKCPEYIDISAFSVSASDYKALSDMIWDDMTDMFHVKGIGYTSFNGKISELYFSYCYDTNTFASMYSDFIAEADKLLDGIKGNNSLSDVEKALLLHDRLALHCEYDIKNLNAGTIPPESYLSYGAIVNCKAVCQGYSEAYTYLLEQVGIKSRICESDALNHAWNIVTIDGKEYHVDVTWDDPTYDITGNVLHTNFLRSSAGIYSTEHDASDYDTSPTDTKYDDYFWQDSDAAFQLLGDEIYYICSTDNSICRMSDNESLFTIDSQWQAGAYSFWNGSFSRLSADGMTLLYNTADTVYSFNPATSENKIIWEPDLSAGKYYSIYGFDYSNGYLLCDVVNTPNYTLTTKDTCVQKMKYDPVAPKVTVSVTNDIDVKQTVTLNISDNDAIAGYYWGTDPSCENNKFTATSSDKINISVFAEGTYYYAVKDISGNVSNVGSLVFFKTELNAASGSVIPGYIVTLKGNTVSLPVPVRDNYDFLGWTDSLSSATYITDVSVNKNSTYYAAWQEMVTVTSMSIYSEPLKKEYYIGDPIDTNGLILNVSYSEGPSEQINSGFTVDGFDSAVNGVCEVTVGYMDFFDTFSVTVIAPSVSFALTDINVEIKQNSDISVVYAPSEVAVTWSSSDPSVASVDDGVITGNSKGVAVITAAIEYNGVIYSADCIVTVSCSHKEVTVYESNESPCVVQGGISYTVCNICGNVQTSYDTEVFSHSFGEWTDSDDGTQIRICSVCGTTEYRLAEDADDKTDAELPDDDVNDDTSDTDTPKQDETDDKTDTELPDDDVNDDTSDTDTPKQDETDDKTDTELPEDNKLILNDGSSLIVNEEKKYVIASVNTDILAQIKNSNVVICDLSGKEISDGSVVGTGYVITVNNIVQYNIVINCDVDGNGKVTAADARLVLRASANLNKIDGVYAQAADYDGNEKITAADARKILRKSAGLE